MASTGKKGRKNKNLNDVDEIEIAETPSRETEMKKIHNTTHKGKRSTRKINKPSEGSPTSQLDDHDENMSNAESQQAGDMDINNQVDIQTPTVKEVDKLNLTAQSTPRTPRTPRTPLTVINRLFAEQTPRRSIRKSIKPAQDYDEIVAGRTHKVMQQNADNSAEENSTELTHKWTPKEVGRVSEKRKTRRTPGTKRRMINMADLISNDDEEINNKSVDLTQNSTTAKTTAEESSVEVERSNVEAEESNTVKTTLENFTEEGLEKCSQESQAYSNIELDPQQLKKSNVSQKRSTRKSRKDKKEAEEVQPEKEDIGQRQIPSESEHAIVEPVSELPESVLDTTFENFIADNLTINENASTVADNSSVEMAEPIENAIKTVEQITEEEVKKNSNTSQEIQQSKSQKRSTRKSRKDTMTDKAKETQPKENTEQRRSNRKPQQMSVELVPELPDSVLDTTFEKVFEQKSIMNENLNVEAEKSSAETTEPSDTVLNTTFEKINEEEPIMIEENRFSIRTGKLNLSDMGLKPIEDDSQEANASVLFEGEDEDMPSLIVCDDDDDDEEAPFTEETKTLNDTFNMSDCIIISPEKMEEQSTCSSETAQTKPSEEATQINLSEKPEIRETKNMTPRSKTAKQSNAYRFPTPYKPNSKFCFGKENKENDEVAIAPTQQKVPTIVVTTLEPQEIVLRSIRKRSISVCVGGDLRKRKAGNVTFYSPANQTATIAELDSMIALSTSKSVLKKQESNKLKNITQRRKRSISLDDNCLRQPSKLPKRILTPSKIRAITPQKPVAPVAPRTKLPNFAAIHEKQFQKMENLVDYVARKADRAQALINSATKLPKPTLSSAQKLTPKPALKAKPKPTIAKPLALAPVNKQVAREKPEERRQRYMELFKGRTAGANSGAKRNADLIRGVRSNRRFELMMQYRKTNGN